MAVATSGRLGVAANQCQQVCCQRFCIGATSVLELRGRSRHSAADLLVRVLRLLAPVGVDVGLDLLLVEQLLEPASPLLGQAYLAFGLPTALLQHAHHGCQVSGRGVARMASTTVGATQGPWRHSGVRFSRKARMPSCASGSWLVAAITSTA